MAIAIKDKNPDMALKIAQEAQKMKKTEAEIASKTSEKMTNEQRNAKAQTDATHLPETPEWKAEYKKNLDKLLDKDKAPVKDKTDLKIIGVNKKTGEAVYSLTRGTEVQQVTFNLDPETNQQKAVPYNGAVDRTASKNEISITSKGRTKFAEGMAETDVSEVKKAMGSRDSSLAALSSLKRMQNLDKQELISGIGASSIVNGANFLNSIGLLSKTDQAKVANSEQYQKSATELVFATLGGKLGAGFSDADRDFVISLVPQLENSAQARKQLIEFLNKKHLEIIEEANRKENYARKNDGLAGYVAKIPLVYPTDSNITTKTTNDELARVAGGTIVNGKFVKNK